MAGEIVIGEIEDITPSIENELRNSTVVGFDCEGVLLCRDGRPSIITIATEKNTYIVDVLDKSKTNPLIEFIKPVLEDSYILKVVHDCRMDSDALYHKFNIKLRGVHDTMVFHKEIKDTLEFASLNETLEYYNLDISPTREGPSPYVDKPEYWAGRPLEEDQIARAAGDVTKLHALYAAQISMLTEERAKTIYNETARRWLSARYAKLEIISRGVHINNIGAFVGKRGIHHRCIEKKYGLHIFKKDQDNWMVFYYDDKKFAGFLETLAYIDSCDGVIEIKLTRKLPPE